MNKIAGALLSDGAAGLAGHLSVSTVPGLLHMVFLHGLVQAPHSVVA